MSLYQAEIVNVPFTQPSGCCTSPRGAAPIFFMLARDALPQPYLTSIHLGECSPKFRSQAQSVHVQHKCWADQLCGHRSETYHRTRQFSCHWQCCPCLGSRQLDTQNVLRCSNLKIARFILTTLIELQFISNTSYVSGSSVIKHYHQPYFVTGYDQSTAFAMERKDNRFRFHYSSTMSMSMFTMFGYCQWMQ